MRILVVGSGGREHALVWRLAQDRHRPELFCAPGNAGTAQIATNLAIEADDLQGIVAWAKAERPALVVVGPEAPLCAGLVDRLVAAAIPVFGPSQAAARLEGSKVFSKQVMEAAGVPTAAARSFTKHAEAMAYVRKQGAPLVVKADGLAAGKGVTVCATVAEAEQALASAMVDRAFGDAGSRVIVEEFLEGEEASILALIDGRNVVLLASAQDHKRVRDNDEGPNTGGMGAYSPAPVVTPELWPAIREQVFQRTLNELNRRGIVYRGVLYAGLMIGRTGIKVLEFNCRFGDPETQAILPRMECDFAAVLRACAEGTLRDEMVRWRPDPCVCVVMAAGGYPGRYEKGKPIAGIADAESSAGVVVFHAGTARRDGQVVTAGGRVLGVTALGRDLAGAVDKVYGAVGRIRFDQAQYRKDIARRALARP
jgi:phosphoribosylamine--glycine ligase